VGALLGELLLSRLPAPDSPNGTDAADPAAVASSVVSSQLLRKIAAAHGVRHAETLTGFKWLARVPGLVYAYERRSATA